MTAPQEALVDVAVVRQHVTLIHEQAARAFDGVADPGFLQLGRISPDGGGYVTTQFAIGDIDGMTKLACEYAAAGHNVYIEARTVRALKGGRGKEEDTIGVFAFVIDADADKGQGCAVIPNVSLQVETSPGNGHQWFFLAKALSVEDAKPIGAAIKKATGTDATGTLTQPYRVAGTPNYPDARKIARGREVTQTRILEASGRLWTPEELGEAFPAAVVETADTGHVTAPWGSGGLSLLERDFIAARLAKPVPPAAEGGNASNLFQGVVNRAVECGMSPDVFEELARANPDGCAATFLKPKDRLHTEIDRSWGKGIKDYERRLREGAAEHERMMREKAAKQAEADLHAMDVADDEDWDAPPSPPVLRFTNAASLAGKPVPPREWHVEGLIPAHNVTLLSGDGATGKTLLGIQLGAATATGTSWIGQLPEPGRAMFVTAEDDMDELHRRLADVCRGQGLRLEDMGGLDLLSLAGLDALLAAPAARSDLLQATPLFARLEQAVMDFRPALLIIDPLADVFGGDEIRKTQARQFIGLLRGLSIRASMATLLLSHPSQAGMSSGEGTSGNVGWSNSVRSRLYFERPKGERDGPPADPDARVLSLKKSNYGPPAKTINLRWKDGVFALAGGSGSSVDPDRRFLELLANFERNGRNVSSTPCSTYAPKLFAQHPDSGGVKKKEFAQAMDRLFSAGKIQIVTEGPQSRQRSRLAIVVAQDDS